jgi:hypothetical protein
MQRHSRLAGAALAGLILAGPLLATLAASSPALADEHGVRGHEDRGRGHVVYRRDDRHSYRPAYVYRAPAPAYVPAYTYPAYGYVAPVYPYTYAPVYAPANGYVHVAVPGFSLGVGF